MTRFVVADDGHGEPVLWAELGGHLFPVVSRSRLDQPSYWGALVAAVLAGQERPDNSTFLRAQSECEHPDWRGDFGDLRAPLGFDRCQRCGLLRCSYCDGKGCPDCKTVISL